ncbi:RcnB family protein [Sphingomonas sp.]|uniref:RcnB family protein n=1 Tax=Sphingomonas sp. TaxID=28214 RepID=UPI0025E9F578|nr:RcnB family protein [Sphingomonas sp.]
MKKMILAALIGATILTPATAIAQERGRWQGRGGDQSGQQRQSPRQEWQQRRSSEDSQRPMYQARERQPATPSYQAPQRQQAAPSYQAPQRQQAAPSYQAPQAQAPQSTPQWQGRRGGGDRGGERTQGRYQAPQRQQAAPQPQYQAPQQYRRDRTDDRRDYRQDQRSQQYRGGDRRDWSRGWRGDRRYDWGSYRQYNRNIYRLPRYYAPAGYRYGYQRFSIGLTIGALLFSQNYWINDPFYYRLPPAYGPYRWVRYYNDALLVDIRTGYVVDVVYDIFW